MRNTIASAAAFNASNASLAGACALSLLLAPSPSESLRPSPTTKSNTQYQRRSVKFYSYALSFPSISSSLSGSATEACRSRNCWTPPYLLCNTSSHCPHRLNDLCQASVVHLILPRFIFLYGIHTFACTLNLYLYLCCLRQLTFC